MSHADQALVIAKNIAYERGGRKIIHNVDLTLRKGLIYTLIGPNGAGKSTLVKLLIGLNKPDQGYIERDKSLHVGYVPQKIQLDKNMPLTVERFLSFANNRFANKDKAKAEIQSVLAEMKIEHLASSFMYSLSGGEQQRVLLARAMLRKPNLLVLDEPVQGVDVKGQGELYQLIGSIRDRYQCGILMVSHDLHLVMSATDEVICLNQHICCHGHPDSVSKDPEYLRLFGLSEADNIAVYTHHHDHHHDLDGHVVSDHALNKNSNCNH